jgi:uncharacterized protein YrrD
MLRYEQVKGLRLITVHEGKEIGKVDDLFVDPDGRKVRWLRVHTGGLFGNREWVATEAIHGVGPNAFMVNSEDDVRAREDAPAAEELAKADRRLIGTPVITEDGKSLSKVEDYEFDGESFAVTSLILPPGMGTEDGHFLVIPIERVVTIGEDLIIVSANSAQPQSVGAPEATGQPELTTA